MARKSSPADPNKAAVDRVRGLRSPKRAQVAKVMLNVQAGYFGTKYDRVLDAEMDEMFDDFVNTIDAADLPSDVAGHLGRQSEGYILYGLGLSGTRKTSTFLRMIKTRKEFEGYSDIPEENTSIIISVSAPSPSTLKLLGIGIATALGYRPAPNIEENAVWDLIRRVLPLRGVWFIHIDEMNHVTQAKNRDEIKKIRDSLKSLNQLRTHPVWLVLTGLPEVAAVIEDDEQIWRRNKFLHFKPLTFPSSVKICRSMVAFFATEKAKLGASEITTDEVLHRIMCGSLFRLGIAIELLRDAIKIALNAGAPGVTVRHLADAFHRRSGCDDENNVFLAAEFTSINVGQFFTEMLATEAGPKAYRKRKKS